MAYENSRWSAPVAVPFSQSRTDVRSGYATDGRGNLYAAWPTDGRDFEEFLFQHSDVYAGRIPLPAGTPVAPALRPRVQPNLVTFNIHGKEAEDLRRIRGYSHRIRRQDLPHLPRRHAPAHRVFHGRQQRRLAATDLPLRDRCRGARLPGRERPQRRWRTGYRLRPLGGAPDVRRPDAAAQVRADLRLRAQPELSERSPQRDVREARQSHAADPGGRTARRA